LNPCTQALRMGDERFLSNVFKRFFIFITFFNGFYFFLNVFYIYALIGGSNWDGVVFDRIRDGIFRKRFEVELR